MAEWLNYAGVYPGSDHTVSGTLKICRNVHSPQTGDQRDLLVYVPPSYANGKKRYPVLYMHDGQNLFDAATSNAGEWQVDETFEALSAEGIEAIVVGIPNLDAAIPGARMEQYSPFPNALFGVAGHGADYLAFVRDTVKPLVDADFRTRPDRASTGIIGSSMGGLISLYAYFHCPDTFGFAGVMSPAFWFTDDDAIYAFIAHQPHIPGKLYMDIGTAELDHIPPEDRRPGITSDIYLNDARRMADRLVERGYRRDQDLRYIEDDGAPHHESAWARRLPDAIRWWLE